MNIPQFRKNLREAFNAAENGEVVEIVRHGRVYHLVVTPFSIMSTDEVSSNIRPNIQKIKKSSVATPRMSKAEKDHHDKNKAEQDKIDSKIQSFMAEKKMKFCANGHAIPDGRSKCMGKGCKYA